jgi:hypothetical protein
VGKVPRHGVVVEVVEANTPPPPPAKIHKNSAKNRRFPTLLGLKIAENIMFCSKILNKIYSPDVF